MVSEEEMQKYMVQPQKPYDKKEIKNKVLLAIENLKLEGKFPDDHRILNELKKSSYFLSIEELHEVRREINVSSQYVLDLAKYNYNGLVEDIYSRLGIINRGCDEIIAKNWTKSKVSTIEEIGHNGRILKKQKVITVEIPGPKIGALNVQKMAVKVHTEILKGSIIDASVAILAREVNKRSQEYNKSTEDLHKLAEEIDNKNKMIAKLKEQKNDTGHDPVKEPNYNSNVIK